MARREHESQALTHLNGMNISFFWSRWEKPRELDCDSSITLHYEEVHSRHDQSTSYHSARRTRLA